MHRRLGVLVFFAGAGTLAAELAGARLLAPFFGASNIVWANVIGLTLIYLSLGYWLGGKLADRYPTPRALSVVVLVGAAAVAALPFVTRPFFTVATDAFVDLSAGALIGSFVGAMLMFAVPLTALGCVAPWAIRLAVTDIQTAGAVAGRLYALSTLGSIVGTFASSLVLIPVIGTQRTMLLSALAIALSTVPFLGRRALAASGALALLLLVPPGQIKSGQGDVVLFEGESPYQYVQISRQLDGDVIMHLNEGWAIHSVLPKGGPGALTGGYWDTLLALPLLYDRPDGRVAVLGNAGGTISNLLGAAWPRTRVDGVDIDPLLADVGRRYMGMGSNALLETHTADARFWLAAQDDGAFDGIVVDAYRQPYIPFHLVSREFFSIVRDRLAPDGVVAINVGTPPGEEQAVEDIAGTMRSVFPAVHEVRFDRFTSIIFGYRDPAAADRAAERMRAAPAGFAALAAQLADGLRPIEPGTGRIQSDDHAPIELTTDRALLAYLREGAPGS